MWLNPKQIAKIRRLKPMAINILIYKICAIHCRWLQRTVYRLNVLALATFEFISIQSNILQPANQIFR